MARLPRNDLVGIPQHLIQRGNNRQACFAETADYRFYLEKLKQYADRYKVRIHSYVLMTNHVHLLLTSDESGSISRVMQSLGRVYVRYFNLRYRRTGTLWEGRFRSTLVDSERYLFTLYRYIEMNPVRAKMVQHPSEYPWSSYAANALGQRDELIQPHPLYLDLSGEPDQRAEFYRSLFDHDLSQADLSDIRDSVNKGWALGREDFQKQMGKQVGRFLGVRAHGGDRRSDNFKRQ